MMPKGNHIRDAQLFAKENIDDRVTLYLDEHKAKRIKFDNYPTFTVEDRTPFRIKLSSSHLSILQLHGLGGEELEKLASSYLLEHFS